MQKNGCGSRDTGAAFYISLPCVKGSGSLYSDSEGLIVWIGKHNMRNDAFSKCHPAVNFLFFVGAIGMSVVIQHPAFLLAGIVTGAVYYLLLNGAKGWRTILGLLPIFVILTAVNPFLNTMGATPLFYPFGRPYTLEALYYGGALASMFVIMMLWFGCYNKVLTSDKFTSLFGNLLPSISLLLVMVFRMVPAFVRKIRQIAGARKCVGKGAGEQAGLREKLRDGMSVLGAMTAWALEGGIITGDSMRARGYGTAKRSSFARYRMTATDWVLLAVMLTLLAITVVAAGFGQFGAEFVPTVELAPVSWGLVAYACYLLIPTVLHIKEVVQWHISRSKI